MFSLLTIANSSEYQKLRLLSLKTDPLAFLSTYEREKTWPRTYFQHKIRHATRPPIFGIYGHFKTKKLVATAQLASEFHPKNQHLANIYDLYIHPDHRRKSLATKFLSHLIDQAKTDQPLEQLHLRANSLNKPAIALYKKFGFTHIATRKNTVKESNNKYQDELFFSLHLNQHS